MPWLRIDDRVRTHPKIVQAGPDASWFWFCGICYCREHLTDGFIPEGMLATLCPGVGLAAAKRLTAKLLDCKLWYRAERGYQIHDFLEWNPSRSSVLEKRQEERDRKAHVRADKTRTPNGRNADTAGDVRTDIVEPVRADSRAGAIARGSGLGSGSGSDLENGRGAGETMPDRPLATRSLVPAPVKWSHGQHEGGFCDWMCFPADLFDQFARRIEVRDGLDTHGARAAVRAWAESVRDSGVVPTGKMYDFWNGQWEQAHGSSTKPDGRDWAREFIRG